MRTTRPDPTAPLFVLVHGAWHGSWCWTAVQRELRARGHDSLTVELPSAHIASAPTDRLPGLADDTAAIARVLAGSDRSVVLVAHSYGGIPATQAAATDEKVAALVYFAAFALRPGQSLSGNPSGELPGDDVLFADDHTQELLFSDLDDEQRAWAAARLTPQSAQAFRDPLTARRDTLPTAYVVTDRDQIMPPDFQRAMAAGTDVVRHVDGGHSAWLSAPAALAEILVELSSTAAPAARVAS